MSGQPQGPAKCGPGGYRNKSVRQNPRARMATGTGPERANGRRHPAKGGWAWLSFQPGTISTIAGTSHRDRARASKRPQTSGKVRWGGGAAAPVEMRMWGGVGSHWAQNLFNSNVREQLSPHCNSVSAAATALLLLPWKTALVV